MNEVYAITEEVSVCSGDDHTYPDGTTAINIVANTSYESILTSQVTGCDSLVTTNITVNEVYTTTEEVNLCLGDDHTYPDGIIETNITTNTSHVSNLFSEVTGCDSTITTNVTVNEVYATTEEVGVCSGDDYTYPDGTTETNIIANTSHISNLFSQVTGCDSTITTNITVNEPIVTLSEVEVCLGEDYTYSDGTIATNITENTSHESILTSQLTGCDSTITTNISVINVNTNVTVDGSTITAENITADAYQWFDCDLKLPIDGETAYEFTVTESGNFGVAIEENNCVDTSSCNSIVISGIEDAESLVQSIWPNPTSDKINIRLADNNAPTEISIFDVTGKLIFRKVLAIKENEFSTELLGEGGIYFVQVKSNSRFATYKIIKN